MNKEDEKKAIETLERMYTELSNNGSMNIEDFCEHFIQKELKIIFDEVFNEMMEDEKQKQDKKK